MPEELMMLLKVVREKCGSGNKMGAALGVGGSSVVAYFKDEVLPGFDKIPALARLSGESEDRVRALLTKAHEDRARKRWEEKRPGPESANPRRYGKKDLAKIVKATQRLIRTPRHHQAFSYSR